MNIQVQNRYVANLNLVQLWINMVLYEREVYPKECFREKTVFNHKVMVAHPGPLGQYIEEFVSQLDDYEDKVREVTLKVIGKESGEVLEMVSLSI